MLGDQILVAPVFEEGASYRNVYLPKGNWVNLWTKKEYEVLDGGIYILENAPLGKIPVYLVKNSFAASLLEGDQNLSPSIQKWSQT